MHGLQTIHKLNRYVAPPESAKTKAKTNVMPKIELAPAAERLAKMIEILDKAKG
jgi:hypothetical protein